MHSLDAALTEQLRVAAREVLAKRPGTALELSGIRRRIEHDKIVDFAYSDRELRGAVAVLIDMEQVKIANGALGKSEYFSATAAGILAFERGQ